MGGGETSGAASWRPLPAVAICKISDALFLSGLLLFAQATQRECDADDYRHDIRRTNSLQKILNVAKEAESAVEDLFKRPETLQQTADLLTKLFPLWIFGAVMLGLFAPKTVTWLQGDGVTICVGATMVFTGMTLDTDDFVRILQQPSQVAMGVMCQYTVMPLAGCVIARVLQLQSDVAAGLILLASCPGGTSSNLITIIAKGDVALSVLMTTAVGAAHRLESLGGSNEAARSAEGATEAESLKTTGGRNGWHLPCLPELSSPRASALRSLLLELTQS